MIKLFQGIVLQLYPDIFKQVPIDVLAFQKCCSIVAAMWNQNKHNVLKWKGISVYEA